MTANSGAWRKNPSRVARRSRPATPTETATSTSTCCRPRPAITRHDLLLRNEGDGRGWQRLDTPTVDGGSADAVVPLDYDGDGRVEFLALNGRNSERGPVQLIALRPAG